MFAEMRFKIEINGTEHDLDQDEAEALSDALNHMLKHIRAERTNQKRKPRKDAGAKVMTPDSGNQASAGRTLEQ